MLNKPCVVGYNQAQLRQN